MNRIYQGRVTKVEIFTGRNADDQLGWIELPDWPDALRQHHQLFRAAPSCNRPALRLFSLRPNLPRVISSQLPKP